LDGKERTRFLKGFHFERELTPEEETLLALLERSAINHGFDRLLSYLSGLLFFPHLISINDRSPQYE